MEIANIFGYEDVILYRDENGKECQRTPISHPYGYDPYIVFGKPNNEIEKDYINGSVYDDRLMQSNYKKFDTLKNDILKNIPFENCSKETIEKFLESFQDHTVKIDLVRVLKGCNVSNGYPYYVFQYHYKPKETIEGK